MVRRSSEFNEIDALFDNEPLVSMKITLLFDAPAGSAVTNSVLRSGRMPTAGSYVANEPNVPLNAAANGMTPRDGESTAPLPLSAGALVKNTLLTPAAGV